ncbi:hypothetical protein EGT07_22790 [Herbaspirillum sp. HC18]|nr:hypothetical protein EGT07_22790 [Herbaspirillum sp. HC18]
MLKRFFFPCRERQFLVSCGNNPIRPAAVLLHAGQWNQFQSALNISTILRAFILGQHPLTTGAAGLTERAKSLASKAIAAIAVSPQEKMHLQGKNALSGTGKTLRASDYIDASKRVGQRGRCA